MKSPLSNTKMGIMHNTAASGSGQPEGIHKPITGEFVSSVDGITFGIIGGRAIHTANQLWQVDNQVRWARANAELFRSYARNLDRFAEAVENGLLAQGLKEVLEEVSEKSSKKRK